MKRGVLIHFKPEEAPERIDRLRRAGRAAEYLDPKNYKSLRAVREDPPDAVVIDLARLHRTAKKSAWRFADMRPPRRYRWCISKEIQ
ncbi:MAG TPA: hypothetical protein VER03_03980 [Bryobacteraceae bacterium]|nr:hypothetical protein [Bryobacteraceae bacterium]